MSVEQLESEILKLALEERRRLALWLDERRDELFGDAAGMADDTSPEQKAEVLRRRQDYREHPERFIRMDEKALEQLFTRIRNVCARVSSTR